MITRRFMMAATGSVAFAASANGPACAEDNTSLPPTLDQLGGLALSRTDGSPTTLAAELGPRRPTVISLWATWCAPCLIETKELSLVRRRAPDRELGILGINIDRDRNEDVIARFLERGGSNYAQVRGETDAVYSAFGGEGGVSLPRLYVFNRKGVATAAFGKYGGGRTIASIDEAVRAVLDS